MKKIVLFLAVFIVISQAQLSPARPTISATENWTLLGSRSVNYLIDHDIISFPESKEPYKALKFIVKNGPLNMIKCTIHFKDGDSKDIEFTDDIKANDVRIVDLKGSYRAIEKVTFWYDSKMGGDKKATIELWGNQ